VQHLKIKSDINCAEKNKSTGGSQRGVGIGRTNIFGGKKPLRRKKPKSNRKRKREKLSDGKKVRRLRGVERGKKAPEKAQ
jgi:hypothetical protein